MALKNMSILAGATVSVTGGTAVAFVDNGVSIPNGIQLVVPADTDYSVRRVATVKYRPPVLDPKTNVYNKDKKSISFVIPQVLSNGSVVFNTLRIEREVHPTFSAANCTDMNKLGAQLLTDTDLDNFWGAGSLS